jgi:hypothetical protein
MWFHAEICEAAQHEAWFVFNLSFYGSELHYLPTQPHESVFYKVISEYYGEICVAEEDLILAMQGSPFYRCFSGLPPFSNDHISPPSSHEYNSEFSFDSVAKMNIQNMLEA